MHWNYVRSAVIACIVVLSCHMGAAHAADADSTLVDRKAGRPMVVAFDVAPGYVSHILLPSAEGDEEEISAFNITLSAPADIVPGPDQWLPTAFVCLRPVDTKGKASYCANLTLHATTNGHGVARGMSETGQKTFETSGSQELDATAPVEVRIVRKGRHVAAIVGGETIDESEIAFAPAFWMIGASTGTARIEAIEALDVDLQPGEWPVTLQAAIDDAIAELDEGDKETLRETPKDELNRLVPGWGASLRDRQGLSRGNDALRSSACGNDCTVPDAVDAIMLGVWTTLQAPSD